MGSVKNVVKGISYKIYSASPDINIFQSTDERRVAHRSTSVFRFFGKILVHANFGDRLSDVWSSSTNVKDLESDSYLVISFSLPC